MVLIVECRVLCNGSLWTACVLAAVFHPFLTRYHMDLDICDFIPCAFEQESNYR
jgi:hypothetical protein